MFTNIHLLKSLHKDSTKYKNLFKELRTEILSYSDNFKDDPKNLSGWGHNYFCEDDGGRIIFNLDSPNNHVCETCNKKYADEKRDKAWLYFYRYKAFEIAYKAAILYKIANDITILNVVKKILCFYADNYSEFEIHSKDKVNLIENGVTGFGKIMPQGLNEAVMLITIINTLEIIKDDLSIDERDKLNLFIVNITEFLFKQRGAYHNIICWINSAVGCAGIYLENETYLDSAINSNYGIMKQLAKGLTADYLWYEGSIHYHFFALEGILNLLLIADIHNYKLDGIKYLCKKMLISAYNLAFDNLIFPNPNDGWPNISLKTYSYIYDLGKKIINDNEIDYIANKINSYSISRNKLPLCEPTYLQDISLNRILFDPDFENNINNIETQLGKSFIYYDSGIAILKNNYFNIFLKFAHKSQSHAHPDLLNIELTIKDRLVLRDLSNPGYGSKLYDTWFKKTLSHNTVIIGGEDQFYTESSNVLSSSDTGISVEIPDAFKRSKIRRDIMINDNVFNDSFYVECEEENYIDFVLHFDIHFKMNFNIIDSDLIYKDNGYEHLFDIKKIETEKESICLYFYDKELSFRTIFNLKNKDIFLCQSYDNPSSNMRNSLILRSFSNKAKFEMSTVVD